MNKVMLIGRLTRDPVMRFTPGEGHAVTSFCIAVDRSYISQNGQRETDFINIVCWRKLAEHVANNLSKGRLVGLAGKIQTRKYQDQDGSTRYITEVLAEEVKFLDWPKSQQVDSDDEFIPIDDSDMPF